MFQKNFFKRKDFRRKQKKHPKRFSGDSYEDPPVPMPNTEVKLINAESTWPEAAREDRKLLIKKLLRRLAWEFFVACYGL